MKKMHLLCNAHLDPVWLWQWGEGAAEAISTFRVAADFCEQYDGFVFNHNEALLYEWVEKYEPELFCRIKKLVADGKWKIMGGWYLQPDCVMLSGESFKSQIDLGREYFEEKFGKVPTTAINFDPFGHTRGLVQILRNAGYDSYIFMRPYEIEGDFWWEGYDGSKILAHGIYGGYNTLKGKAVDKIDGLIKDKDDEICLCLWGIGNHGGGPSRVDLEKIAEYMKNSDVEIIHSSAEEYMSDIDTENIPVISKSLIPCMVGCYTSMVRIKQANRRLENKIAMTEKIMSYADMQSDFEFDREELAKAKKTLAFCQFHDILPGSAIKPVEDDSLRSFAYGEEIADKLYTQAFFKLCEGQKKTKDGEIPILVFNPHPYEIEGEFELGFMMEDQNWNKEEITFAKVYDKDGNFLPTQNEKPECTFNLDWIQKISFRGKIAPSSVTRFDCVLNTVKKDTLKNSEDSSDAVVVKNDRMEAVISKKTGLIEKYAVDGKILVENGGVLNVYKDNEDPWGMTVDSFKDFEGSFTLMSDEAANEFIGYPEEKIQNVRIIEDGEVRVKVQALFEYKRNVAAVEYTIPRQGAHIDAKVTLFSNEPNRMIKYCLDTKITGKPWGETAFGMEELFSDEKESVFHKWCGIKNSEDKLYIVNNGIYGGSFTENSIKLSLLRTPVYSAHPIEDRQIAPHNRMHKHIDMGEREFTFRILAEENIEREAQIFNEAPYLMSFFPSGMGEKKESAVVVDNPDVILSSVRKNKNGFELTLHNFSEYENDTKVTFGGKKFDLHFGKFELKTVII